MSIWRRDVESSLQHFSVSTVSLFVRPCWIQINDGSGERDLLRKREHSRAYWTQVSRKERPEDIWMNLLVVEVAVCPDRA